MHRGGKMAVPAVVPVRDGDGLSLAYTPGVAKVCSAIAEQPDLVHDYTWKSGVVAVVTDGTAVLGLGDIGPEASLPVMEGKAILFKQFGGVDAVPIALNCTDADEIVETVVRLAPSFGGVNLEDISAPRCFEIERKLQERLDIPAFHDDPHGTGRGSTLAGSAARARLSSPDAARELRPGISGAGGGPVSAIAKLRPGGRRSGMWVVDRGRRLGRPTLTVVKQDGSHHEGGASGPRAAGLAPCGSLV
ncbi:NADP-dependent malic enzyme OS=Streptomyces tendae OX=1932 GN=GUR47_14535 PE=3 SV=1 [Streptomyces tendae]